VNGSNHRPGPAAGGLKQMPPQPPPKVCKEAKNGIAKELSK